MASRIAFFRSFVRFKKKLTVIGIIGQTQGVNKATKPPKNPAKKINNQLVSAAVIVASPKAFSSSITGSHKSVFPTVVVLFAVLVGATGLFSSATGACSAVSSEVSATNGSSG